MSLVEEKLRAREQWGQDPCGAEYDREHELGTREFFDEVERYRYREYAPWMPRVMGFDQFRDAKLLEIGCDLQAFLIVEAPLDCQAAAQQIAGAAESAEVFVHEPEGLEQFRLHLGFGTQVVDFGGAAVEHLARGEF